MKEVLSLGAGVQSTTMALMAAHGEITPMPTAAIFADTGGEPQAVYKHLQWLTKRLPFPVHVVQWRNLRDDILASSRKENVAGRPNGYVTPPFHTLNADGSRGMIRRECTQNYKLDPIRWGLKELVLGIDRGQSIRLKKDEAPLIRTWIGISADEAIRVKSDDVRWITKRYPLIDNITERPHGKRLMTRGHCIEWLQSNGYQIPPRSACTFCPYRSNKEWRDLHDNHPEDFADAVLIDNTIRDFPERKVARLREGGTLYLHSSLKPLEEVDLTDPHEGQELMFGSFGDECDGICGV